MQYFQAYRFAFESPKWINNVLIAALCQFVPIAGQMTLLGYLYETIEAKHRYGANVVVDFDIQRLGNYLSRGVWPFIVSIVGSLPLMLVPIAVWIMMALWIPFMRPGGEPEMPAGFFVVIFGFAGAFLVLAIAVNIIVMPMTLRAGLMQDFVPAFSFSFVQDFLRLVWVELLLAMLFLLVTMPFVMLAGLAMFCVGIYVASAVVFFANYHLHYQLYELYLERGGAPIPLKSV
ncbi:MAG TPA: DUF4013 domain-containing protein [Terriglobia bacterium]|nr:DUF4013 domain-containing protein [Terriglobia bacterium]